MTVIVSRKDSGERFLVIGAGLGKWSRSHSHAVFGNWAPVQESRTHSLLALSDAEGRTGWIDSAQLRVESAGGYPPRAILEGKVNTATVVQDRQTGSLYVVLGAGFAASAAAKPSFFFGNLVPDKSSQTMSLFALSDADGNIGWLSSGRLAVVLIGGTSPADALAAPSHH